MSEAAARRAALLRDMAAPGSAAILCMEMQNGVVGPASPLPALAESVAAGDVIASLGRLLRAGRAAGIPVIFCNVAYRADGRGQAANAPMFAAMKRLPGHMIDGTAATAVVAGLDAGPEDFVISRAHGMSPFTGTALDATLRGLGVRTVIATGVSLNIGVFAMVVEAVGLGYRAIVPRDCTAGVPPAYGDQVLDNSLAPLATLASGEALVALWQGKA
jgi:nicotinamidase-related amidase